MNSNRSLRLVRAIIQRGLAVGAVVSLVIPASVFPAAAAVSRTSFNAMVVSVSSPKTMAAGERSVVQVTFKNTGSAAWAQSGSNYVSLYHYDSGRKVETPSLLSTAGWNGDTRPSKLPVASVAPGASVTFTFPIAAPSAPGTYKDEYILVAENLVRLANSKISTSVIVTAKTAAASNPIQPASSPTPAATTAAAPAAQGTPVSTGGKWAGELVSKGGSEWQLDIDQNVYITLTFKNTGTETWNRSTGSYVSLYATEPSGSGSKERASSFATTNWKGNQAATMVESSVKPGQIGTFKVEVRPSQPGKYNEEFMLAAEGQAWMGGTRVVLPINVPLTGAFIATAPPGSDVVTSVPVATQANNGRYTTSVLLRSVTGLTLSGNGRQQLTYGFKNTGTSIWTRWSLTVTGVQPALTNNLSSVRDDSWHDSATPAVVSGTTKPGELGFLTFTLKAPAKKGTYTAKFQLMADGIAVDGGSIDIPITVTADGYIEPAPQPTPSNPTPSSPSVPSQPAPALNPQPLNGSDANLPNEPIIRVGLYQPDDAQMVVTARYSPLTVTNNGQTICHLASMQSATISYNKSSKMYSISGACSGSGTTWYVVRADDGISPIEMTDYNRPVSWLPGANDNSFRAQLELRASQNNNELWVINELPIEWYLKGIGETSNSSPQQYQRALLTAARTYAMYHVQRGTKHAAQFYTVDATYDQVYRGYGAEARDPAVVQAVDATRGQIVTYQGQLAITPYYSRSDGRTRSWSEVWGGSVPWCVSVPVPWDNGKTLWGHGVGMSATGALQMDAKDGYTYDRILSYFYTGTELRKAYK